MDVFMDYCLACDRPTPEGKPYCSESCRLIDGEKDFDASIPTPTNDEESMQLCQSFASSRLGTGSGYVLAPPYKFPNRPTDHSAAGPHHKTRPQSSYFMRSPVEPTPQAATGPRRSLTSSPSRSSLSSTTSSSSRNSMSEQAQQELQGFFNAFGQSREAKRRRSMY